MSVKVSLEHRTSYTFAHAVNVSPHVVRLRPAPHARTPIEAYSLQIEPKNHFLNWQQDPFGNWLARIVFPEKVTKLEINVGVIADLMVINPFDFFVEEYAETFPFAYEAGLAADLAPYFAPVGDSTAVAAWREELNLPQHELSTTDFLVAVNSAVNAAVGYSVRMEPGVQTPDHTLDRAIGSCRDSAWLLVAVLRQFGLAARFVSGYLVQLAADEESLDGPSGPKEDFTDLHAWTEVFVPGAGWVGLDPTSALFAGEGHIPLSATPHPSSAAPIEGLTDPVEVTFGFSNVVRRIHEDPRVTKPYTDEQWQRVDALGAAIDERLLDGDVRLTMGGEPTFVALDDMTSPQWNTDADGENKRELAGTLAAALQQAYAAGGIVHRGQGKWYPGEPLPRWNIALQWLKDGTALWNDPALFADPWDASRAVDDAPARAAALAAEVTRLLGLPAEQLLAAYEDPFAVVAAEAQRPDGSPPEHDPKGRNASRQLLTNSDRGLNAPTGHVLPLTTGEDGWTSPTWRFRRGRLVLLGGTSPVGLRLPLDAISWSDPKEPGEPSYLVAGPPITAGIPQVEVVGTEDAHGAAQTTALTFEGRDGFVHVFLPPTTLLTDYAALLAVVEDAARALEQPLVIEGYGPPPDPRMVQLVVTPDPGVIEVNVQPTSSWAEQRDLTTGLYDLARRTRLTTEKFDLDGTHTGTGGGNHITLGGAEPAESPLLRRPDLLVSMVSYWQRHPSLSYLFSGRFVGPTSQAPRFDEGRPEAVYEMEIAFAEIARLTAQAEDQGEGPRPWLVDRALRHLLTDLVGNTHRSEFCIDKMYSPDSSRGRLGLLELRGFEMPPHPQMALVQVLLVRSLVAMFWERPATEPLVRWGTALHDDFLLPHGAIHDIRSVVADLNAYGIPFEESWLDPFTEFRFPRIGVATAGDVELELRNGIEPWLVLGEEATSGGTARYVDSSVERLQVSARGFVPGRHLVTCQGVPVPMTPTGTAGEYYAGVRFRAWQPWSALHPSIEAHAPLHFDVVDLASATSLGGATYHVVHPGGRSYEHPPVNAQSAEARRSSRFEARGHTPGAVDVGALRDAALATRSPEYPRTLDLRRARPGRPT